MRKLVITISALALTAGMAQAQITGEGPVFDAWMDSAAKYPVLPPFDPNDPTPPGSIDPLKPDPLEIPMRMYKDCGLNGQCAYVDQVGNGNEIDINQTNAPGGSVADVIQIGNLNQASVEQRTGATGPLAHYGVITQNGDENDAAIRQHSDIVTGATYADIQQGGDGTNGGGLTKANRNRASIDQGIGAGGGDVPSYGNKAKILQEGVISGEANDNEAAIVQRGDNMRSLIEQDGDLNLASILQTGDGGSAGGSAFEDNEARITQVGLENAGAIWQDGQFQLASIDQNGLGNGAYIQQDGIAFGAGNTALIDQDGDDNWSSIWQTGDGNMASSTQEGNSNESSIGQFGNGNMAYTAQTGLLNWSAVEQIGNNNTSTVVQNGFDLADVQQTGNGNIAAVNQQ